MCSVTDTINRTIPISMFNDGRADEVFDEVQNSGTMVVMKNNAAKYVIMSADYYLQMSDEYNDFKLLLMAEERWKNFDPSKLIPAEDVYRELGITQEELDAMPEVELE